MRGAGRVLVWIAGDVTGYRLVKYRVDGDIVE